MAKQTDADTQNHRRDLFAFHIAELKVWLLYKLNQGGRDDWVRFHVDIMLSEISALHFPTHYYSQGPYSRFYHAQLSHVDAFTLETLLLALFLQSNSYEGFPNWNRVRIDIDLADNTLALRGRWDEDFAWLTNSAASDLTADLLSRQDHWQWLTWEGLLDDVKKPWLAPPVVR